MDRQPGGSELKRSGREILVDIAQLTPKVTDYYWRDGSDEQKVAFLADDTVHSVKYDYPRLIGVDFAPLINDLARIREEVVSSSEMNPRFLPHYLNLVDENISKYKMLQLVQDYHVETDEKHRAEIREAYLQVNGEIYGTPQHGEFESVIKDTYDQFERLQLSGAASDIRTELFTMHAKPAAAKERFRPSSETVEWLGHVVDTLYGNLLQHVPAPTSEEMESSQERLFDPNEIQKIFDEIIKCEFGESAEDWKVEFVASGPIEVDRIHKRINIPRNRKPVTRAELRGLVVHELGVHFLRGVMGYEMDDPLHALGFRDYRLLEEGAGVANQQALKGEYSDSGDSYYIVASLMELEGKDRRETFEFMWRYFALKRIGAAGILDVKSIAAARSSAYGCIDRMTKGMDDVPSNMDLSYYIGSNIAWRYYEKNIGDPDAVTRFFMSRSNTDDIAELALALAASQLTEQAVD